MGLRATAQIFAVEPKTVLGWLMAAAEHSAAVSTYFLHDLKVSQIQLDDLFALVAEWRTQSPTEAEAEQALERLPRCPRWVWRTSHLAKTQAGLERSLVLFQADYHLCLPHASWSSTRQPKTPAMAAGITTQVWSVQKWLLFRVPPWPQPLLE